jgi:hypothetical protein
MRAAFTSTRNGADAAGSGACCFCCEPACNTESCRSNNWCVRFGSSGCSCSSADWVWCAGRCGFGCCYGGRREFDCECSGWCECARGSDSDTCCEDHGAVRNAHSVSAAQCDIHAKRAAG